MDSFKKRIKKLNSVKAKDGDSVVYVMSRDQRVEDNFAFEAAVMHAMSFSKSSVAETSTSPLQGITVCFILYPSVRNRTFQHYEFMIEGLKEVEKELQKLNIPFKIYIGETEKNLKKIEKELKPSAIYFDFSPLRGPRNTKSRFAKQSKTPCYVVDTHNIVPVWEVSEKEEYAARTIRPKIAGRLEEFLETPLQTPPNPLFEKEGEMTRVEQTAKSINWKEVLDKIKAPKLKDYEPIVKPGNRDAHKVLNEFIKTKLVEYAEKRNDPTEDFQSNLSAYLHFGQISSFTIVNRIRKEFPDAFEYFLKKIRSNRNSSKIKKQSSVGTRHALSLRGKKSQKTNDSVAAFLEELIVRKELSDNFCYYNKNYDNLKGAKDWAIESLKQHKKDKREYIYSLEELEEAKTHDEAWNAAQTQAKTTGKMHGYMRMYWAKKILEWNKIPRVAIKNAIYLNDRYHLDGYDPNGYTGIMWSIGGIHDRPWFEREIFGKIRYMNESGLKKKFDIKSYVERWSQ